MILNLLGYMPDSDPTVAGVLINASAAVPSLRGMKGAPSPVTAGMATLAATCQGAAAITKLDASKRFFAGTPTKLYEAAASTWTDVSRSAAYTPTNTLRWRFAQFGNTTLAVNGADTMQASVSAGAFSDVAGSPIATIIETVGAFVLVFNTSSDASGWQCAGINNYTSWATSIATQATSGSLTATPGPITAARKFGSQIVAYKNNSMYLGTNVGPPNIWQFDQIPGTAGAMSQESVVNIGTSENPKHIIMGEDNFYIYDGSKPVPIGTPRYVTQQGTDIANRVKITVFTAILQSRYYACAALHDRINGRVYFYYPIADSVFPDSCVVYNYRTDKWGVDNRQIEIPCEWITPGISYDSLGASYNTYNDLPLLPYGIAFLSNAQPQPAFFGTNSFLQTLTGVAGNTSITTGDIGEDEQFNCLSRVRPRFLTAPTSATMTNYYRNNPGDSLTMGATTTLSSNNTFDALRDARWHRLRFSMVGDWEMGVADVEYAGGGFE